VGKTIMNEATGFKARTIHRLLEARTGGPTTRSCISRKITIRTFITAISAIRALDLGNHAS